MNELLKGIKVLHLMMGQQCNVRCTMCYQRTYDPASNMPAVIYKKHLVELYPHLSRMIIMGGEPTVMPNCRELVQFIDRFSNIRFFLLTNGVCIDDFWMGIFKERSDIIRVSINAATRKTYDRITKYGDFNKVIENVRQIIKGKVEKKPAVVLSAVLLRHNVHEIAEFIELGHELGADKVRFCVDPVLSFYKVSAKDVRIELDKAYRTIERTGMVVEGLNAIARHVNYSRSEGRVDSRAETCHMPFTNVMVDGSGDVRACCWTWRILGNIYKTDLNKILENWQRMRLQKMVGSGDYSWCSPCCPHNPAPRKISRFTRYLYLLRKDPGNLLMDGAHRLEIRRRL